MDHAADSLGIPLRNICYDGRRDGLSREIGHSLHERVHECVLVRRIKETFRVDRIAHIAQRDEGRRHGRSFPEEEWSGADPDWPTVHQPLERIQHRRTQDLVLLLERHVVLVDWHESSRFLPRILNGRIVNRLGREEDSISRNVCILAFLDAERKQQLCVGVGKRLELLAEGNRVVLGTEEFRSDAAFLQLGFELVRDAERQSVYLGDLGRATARVSCFGIDQDLAHGLLRGEFSQVIECSFV